ncbi:hypothetical protein F8M41_010722 [Gigaspora margarita]|uniref:Uncharacterized protein n=1 Tax=Gigaspora margarita TaxID=4874 RepID=A0A8H3X1A8_GIGMA|nr:hypothetical protein F8M41_010722 [Gigaspora margarita]
MPIFLASNSDQNHAYAMKTYNCCKGNSNLTSDVIGPFEFGTYRFLEDSKNNEQEDINNLRLDDLKCIIEIRDQGYIYEEVVINKEKTSGCWFAIPHSAKMIFVNKKKNIKENKRRKILETNYLLLLWSRWGRKDWLDIRVIL